MYETGPQIRGRETLRDVSAETERTTQVTAVALTSSNASSGTDETTLGPLISRRPTDQRHQDARARACRRAQPSGPALNMIIISEPSANMTQPVRTSRYTPARCRSSAARNDTPRYADARSISVHTEEVNRSRSAVSGLRRASLRDRPVLGAKVVGHPGRGYPVASAPRRSRSGVGVQLVQRDGCSSWTPTPDLLRGKLADATGYPLPYPYIAAG